MATPIDQNPSGDVGKLPIAEIPTEERIENLKKALQDVKAEIHLSYKESFEQVGVMIGVCTTVSLFIVCVVVNLLKSEDYPDGVTQMIYYTTTRIIVVTGMFSIASFCFRLLRSYLHIYQRSRHRKLVINSMANLVESNSTYTDRQKIYNKLLDIVVNYDRTGILNKENDFKLEVKSMLDILKSAKD